jgi:N-glycosylase/DNA lyase
VDIAHVAQFPLPARSGCGERTTHAHARARRISSLKRHYRRKRREIERRLEEFKRVFEKGEKEIFGELAYCICTAQAKAEAADRAIRLLKASDLLYSGDARRIKPYLRYVRFWNKKPVFIVEARRTFTEGGRIVLKRRLKGCDPFRLRDELVSTVRGLGYKEASHFLRNVGVGEGLAILDRYILRCLRDFGVIHEIPKGITRKRYLEIEERMRRFARSVGIPMGHLDLLLWWSQTGRILR